MHAPDVLQLQREIIDQSKTLGETAAGIAVAGDLYKARRAHERQLKEIETEMKGQLAKMDAVHAAELGELKADVEEKLTKAKDEKRALKRSMQDMHTEEERLWEEKIKVLDRQFRDQLAAKEEELLDMEESLREIRDDMARRSQRPHQKQQAAREAVKHGQIISNARQEVFQARDAYQKFRGRRVISSMAR